MLLNVGDGAVVRAADDRKREKFMRHMMLCSLAGWIVYCIVFLHLNFSHVEKHSEARLNFGTISKAIGYFGFGNIKISMFQ